MSETVNAKHSADSVLSVRDLTVEYSSSTGTHQALREASLEVQRGEILGIAGESGSGKTTLAVALLRLLKPPARVVDGRVLFWPRERDEVDLLSLRGRALRSLRWRNLAYLPQGSMNSLNPVSRVREQFADVIMAHAPERKSQIPSITQRLLEQMGLEANVAQMYPHELSGGMRQRVLMAIAMVLEPDILIADEPTTALDVTIQRVVLQQLAQLREAFGVTIMLISHDMGVHAQLVDRVAVLYEGQFVEVGDVRQVFKQPKHSYTRTLIDSIPTMEGTATGGSHGPR